MFFWPGGIGPSSGYVHLDGADSHFAYFVPRPVAAAALNQNVAWP
jgi:hypothetical protein